MARRFFFVSLGLLALVLAYQVGASRTEAQGTGTFVAMTVWGTDGTALTSSGDVWKFSAAAPSPAQLYPVYIGNIAGGPVPVEDRLPGPTCAWHAIATIPGAAAFDWAGGTSNPLGVVVTTLGQILHVQLVGQTLSTVSTSSHPFADPVGIGYPGTWIQRANGELWFDWGGQWYGPCDLPGGPVPVEGSSWGQVKSRFK